MMLEAFSKYNRKECSNSSKTSIGRKKTNWLKDNSNANLMLVNQICCSLLKEPNTGSWGISSSSSWKTTSRPSKKSSNLLITTAGYFSSLKAKLKIWLIQFCAFSIFKEHKMLLVARWLKERWATSFRKYWSAALSSFLTTSKDCQKHRWWN